MNWLGAGIRVLACALVGCALGVVVFLYARQFGVDLPPIVGILAGIGAMVMSTSASGARGLVVGSIAVWACAIAEVTASPIADLGSDLLHFEARLGLFRLAAYALCAAAGIVIGGRAARSRAREQPEPSA